MCIDLSEYTNEELGNLYIACHDAIKEANSKKNTRATPLFVRLFLQVGLEICQRMRQNGQRVGSQYERTSA